MKPATEHPGFWGESGENDWLPLRYNSHTEEESIYGDPGGNIGSVLVFSGEPSDALVSAR
jgi:hypothetical protein